MASKRLRLIFGTALLFLSAWCVWFAFREDPMVATLGLLPLSWASFLDLHPLARSFPAFFIIGFLGAGATAGLRTEWRLLLFVFLFASPYLKDLAQTLVTITRHYNGHAVLLGLCGAAAGWLSGCLFAGLAVKMLGRMDGREV